MRRTVPDTSIALTALMLAALVGLDPASLVAQSQEGADAGEPRTTIPREEFGKWERLAGSTLSPAGEWVAVSIARVDEKNELRIRPVSDPDSTITIAYGGGAAFSDDGRWLAYRIGKSEEERERLRKQNEPVRSDMGLLDLRTGDTTRVEEVASFAFSHDGRFLAMRRYPPGGDRDADGVDLVLRDLESGLDTNFGNVSEYGWQDEGPLLAMLLDAEGMAGNGVQVYHAPSARLVTLDSRDTRYTGLEWREDAADLAALRQVPDDAEGEEGWTDTTHVILAWTDLDAALEDGRPAPEVFDPAAHEAFPPDHRIVPWEDPSWSEDGATVFFGIKERTPEEETCEAEVEEEEEGEEEPDAEEEEEGEEEEGEGDEEDACEEEDDDEEPPTVEIWHADDVEIVPQQKVRASRERRENDLSAWHLEADSFVRLEDELTEDVRIVEGADFAVGLDETPYEIERMFGPVYRDVYTVDLSTGEKERVVEKVQYFMGTAPEGRRLLYLRDDQYWTVDPGSGEHVSITEGLPTDFVDVEDDHTVDQKPPFGTGGWIEGGESVLLYDEHDVWLVAVDGSGGERITRGAENGVRHRRVRLDFEEDAVDPDAPQYFSLYDDWAEAWGYGRAGELGDDVERLVWDEARIYFLRKADEADVFSYRVQSFEDSPDLFVGGGDLAGAVQLTRTNPFQDDYLWGRSELVTYTNERGDTLQGSLYYPAGYEPGRQYPMITYIYEIRSPQVRSYQVPSDESYYNFQTWIQDGYFVFQPDIVYEDRDPGVSAVRNVVPAVERVLETGMVDPDAVGLIGHSWGGYQTTFMVTQTDIFSAAVAGAPLTNLFSMYLSVYWNSGGTDARIFEISQGRMEVPFWEDEAAYKRNSPVFHIENMNTPLLMAQGTEDGAVDFNQGVEFYNAARRAGKDFVFLVYNDENHGFRQDPNQRDYYRRINEWFGHYLKGQEAPEWITEGVPYLEQPGGQRGN